MSQWKMVIQLCIWLAFMDIYLVCRLKRKVPYLSIGFCLPYLYVVQCFLEFLKLKLVCLCSYFWKEALAWKQRMKMGQFLFMMLVLGVGRFPYMHFQQFNLSGVVFMLVYTWYFSF